MTGVDAQMASSLLHADGAESEKLAPEAAMAEAAEKDDLAMPPGLPGPVTVQGSEMISLPPGFNDTTADSVDALTPKKVPLRSFQSAMGQTMPVSSEVPKKKFCVFCGMQVDPKYLTAKFCAFCGMEHVQLGPSKPSESRVEPASPVAPIAMLPAVSPHMGEYKLDPYDETADFLGLNSAEYYHNVATLAWRGMSSFALGNTEEHYEEMLQNFRVATTGNGLVDKWVS